MTTGVTMSLIQLAIAGLLLAKRRGFRSVAGFALQLIGGVIAAASLQFIGFGDPSSLSWGTMLYWAQNGEALQTGQYLWAIVPGACIALLGAAFALLNYAFDEIGNPALRPVRKRRARTTA